MPTTGQLAFGSYTSDNSGGAFAWSTPSNAGASDNTRTACSFSSSQFSQYLKGLGITGGSVPTGGTVTTAIVRVEVRGTGNASAFAYVEAKLVLGGAAQDPNKAEYVTLLSPASDTVLAFVWDLATDLGGTWTATQANAADTGVRFQFGLPDATPAGLEVDYLSIEFIYTLPSLATPTLAVSDAGTGTSGTATVSGSTSTATNTLYYQSVANRGGSWTSAGSRTGNGTISISGMTAGYYWWKVESSDGTDTVTSNLVYQPLLSDAAAMQKQVWDAVKARMQEVTFSGIPTTRIYQKHELDVSAMLDLTKPCLVLTLDDGLIETSAPGTNERDDIGYPVACIFLDDNNRSEDGARLLWRQQAMDALREQRLTGISESLKNEIEPLSILGERATQADLWWSGFVVRCLTRRPRGLT